MFYYSFLKKYDSFFTTCKILKTETWHRPVSLKKSDTKTQPRKENTGKWRTIPKLPCGIAVIVCNGKVGKVDKECVSSDTDMLDLIKQAMGS